MFTRPSIAAIAALAVAGFTVAPAAAQCPPSSPRNLHANQNSSCTGIHLNWSDVSGATRYDVYRNTSNSWSSSSWVGSNVASQFTDLTATRNTRYYYWVTATRGVCWPGSRTSGPSSSGEIVLGSPPATPTNIQATRGACNGIAISWDVPAPALGAQAVSYNVYRNTTNLYLTSTLIGTTYADEPSFFDESTGDYYYWIQGRNGCGNGTASDSVFGSARPGTAPSNNRCGSAAVVTGAAPIQGSTVCATNDASPLTCHESRNSPDVWYRFDATRSGTLRADTCAGASFGTVLAIYDRCGAGAPLACGSGGCGTSGRSVVEAEVQAGNTYYIRIAGRNAEVGSFTLTVTPPEIPCYPDCDENGTLDFFDFLCFQNAFLAQDPYADCDGSGALDFFDFLCFQNEFLAGCP